LKQRLLSLSEAAIIGELQRMQKASLLYAEISD
jgi:hypothetical protein